MRTLILLRHGEAAPAGAGGDIERALTARGEKDAAAAGRSLAKLGIRPDLVLVSPARRTRQSWAAASAFLASPTVSESRELLHTGAKAILAAAQTADAEVLMVVGHNPGLAELTDQLARLSPKSEAGRAFATLGFAPASAAVFARTADGWRFDAFIPPQSAA